MTISSGKNMTDKIVDIKILILIKVKLKNMTLEDKENWVKELGIELGMRKFSQNKVILTNAES